MKFAPVLLVLILVSLAAAAQERTLTLTSSDFASGKTIVITAGEYTNVRVKDMYADQVQVLDNKLNQGGKKVGKCIKQLSKKDPFSNYNSFDIDITCLGAGTYFLDTWACYMDSELTLVIVPPVKSKTSKSGY